MFVRDEEVIGLLLEWHKDDGSDYFIEGKQARSEKGSKRM